MLPGQIFCDIESAECGTTILKYYWCHLYSKKLDSTNCLLNFKRDTSEHISRNFMWHLVHWWWLAKRAFGLANKNSWIIWLRIWILFGVSEKSRWNEWSLFLRSQSCKNQSLIFVGGDFSLIICSSRTKHWIGTQDSETVHKKSTEVYLINEI